MREVPVTIELPTHVTCVLDTLARHGHAAYVVGGCVRDSLLGKQPHDWDVATSAPPDVVKQAFAQYRTIDVGIAHGTVCVLIGRETVEITTYRIDGAYSDARHPDSVQFTDHLESDLQRRDFTVNAMAYSPDSGLVDLFGGIQDLRNGVLRCVGDAPLRFREDALRVLRALRFASVLGFSVAPDTADAARNGKEGLRAVSAERIQKELCKLLMGNGVEKVLGEYPEVLSVVIPEIAPCIGFNQHNRHHCYDVWTHTVKSVAAAPARLPVRLAMLLHDLGKPETFAKEDGVGHFYGHEKHSAAIAVKVLDRLRFDNRTMRLVVTLVANHMLQIQPTKRSVKRRLSTLTPEVLFDLFDVMRADTAALAPEYRERLAGIDTLEDIARGILEEHACFSLKQLVVNGDDMLALGLRGPQIGKALQDLLQAVMDGRCPNERDALTVLAASFIKAERD